MLLNPHYLILSDKIRRPLHISHPQRDEMLMRDGEWFFSLLHYYVSRAEWDCVLSPFTDQCPKDGATVTTYQLTARSRPITTMCFCHSITIRSTRLRSNDPSSSYSHFFWYPNQFISTVCPPDSTTNLSPSPNPSTRHVVHAP